MFSKIYDTPIDYNYSDKYGFNRYPDDIMRELVQSTEEGLDIEQHKSFFEQVAAMENGAEKTEYSNRIFEIILNADLRPDYKYIEPNDLEGIRKERRAYDVKGEIPEKDVLRKKVLGAWTGRAIGCLLGKPVEGARTDELIPLLKETGNYPMHRYFLSTDVAEEKRSQYKFYFNAPACADVVDGMPVDDDTNYVVLAQKIIEQFGKGFDSNDVANAWMKYQSVFSYFTAERIAYVNFINCIEPPASAMYKNVCREWIGAQIRGDYFGYICPGDPEKASELAFKDARISHVKNGIYGEMLVSAMISCAAITDDIEDIIKGGLAQIPKKSRLYEAVTRIITDYKKGVSFDDCCKYIHSAYDEHTDHGWCHVISNAMIVAAALLYGEGDFGKSICMAVQTAFDTDCNGATVGSVLGMRGGIDCIPDYWKKPVNNKIHTSIFGVGTVDIQDAVDKTMEHIEF
ncbi:MAG: ADP-ribosylglycohydrolase family protein [Clostridia bacterium]|nr:ADP-ribosylglycohydrolase family protein [Clostridia bacterium]